MAPRIEPATSVDANAVHAAHAAIGGAVIRTPVARSHTLSEITGAEVWVKFENLQFTGSYKERGALAKLLSLDAATRSRGVVAASAGNFAQAVAYHGRRLGVAVTIVMPTGTPSVKVARTSVLGAEVVLHGATFDDAKAHALALETERGLEYLSPFDDPEVVAGQGTTAIELLADAPELEVLVVPVGGGGLLAGMAVAARSLFPDIALVGVQTDRYPSMFDAFHGRAARAVPGGPTIAEGIAVAEPGLLTARLIREHVTDVVTVPEGRIEEAVCLYLEVEKTVAEGAGAAGLAALLEYPDRFRGQKVGLVLTGGNIDLLLLASVITRGMVRTHRLTPMTIELPDSPGSLGAVTALVGASGGNILDVVHERHRLDIPSRIVRVTLTVETRGQAHADDLVAALRSAGYATTVIDT